MSLRRSRFVIVWVFDLNLISAVAGGEGASGDILTMFVIALGADGAHSLIKRVQEGAKAKS